MEKKEENKNIAVGCLRSRVCDGYSVYRVQSIPLCIYNEMGTQ